MAICNFPKGDLYSHESILEQKLRQKGVLNDDEYSSQDLDWILICTLAKKRSIFQQRPHCTNHPNPKFLGTAAAYFVCHIGPIFQISLIYAFIGCP